MIINLKSETDLSGFYVVYEGSTNLEKKGIYGISHLMEHLVCKSFDDLQEDFDRDGIDWNAYTSSNEIVFFITGLDEKVSKWKDEFLNRLGNFNITKEQFENERNIVLEEYADSFNDQGSAHMLNLYRKLFNDYDPIGLREDLENLKFMDCLKFFETQYLKPTKIVSVSKGKKFKSSEFDFAKPFKSDKKIEFGNYKTTLELGNDFKDKTSIIISSPIIDKDFAKVHFINSMLSLGLKSPLYQEVRENKGLVYFIHCYQSRMNNQGINTISTQTSNKNADKVIDTIKDVISAPEKFLTKDRFNLVKDYYLVRRKKDEILRYKSIGKYLSPEGWAIDDILDDIKLSDIKKVYDEHYDFKKFHISNDKKEFRNKTLSSENN